MVWLLDKIEFDHLVIKRFKENLESCLTDDVYVDYSTLG